MGLETGGGVGRGRRLELKCGGADWSEKLDDNTGHWNGLRVKKDWRLGSKER